MDQTVSEICPQCHHHNEAQATVCELCDWPLTLGSEETQVPALNAHKLDLDQTIDPNAISDENVDPDLTIAPAVLRAEKSQVKQQKTFKLAGDLSQFEVIKVLGQGGMGMVYHAKDKTLGRDVALKMLRPIAGNNFNTEALLDEARVASKLNHPNIVTIYDVARSENSNYIVMEWVDGQSLDELIPDDGLPLEVALSYACQVAEGLSSAHQKYIIHRDIKPQNIMLSEQSTLKILDFGIAGLIEHLSESDESKSSDEVQSNQTTPSAGTPSYMSPEQAQGLNLDQRSDIFSFGLVFYQMLTGQRAFVGENAMTVKQAICQGDYIPLQEHKPDIPQNVVLLADKMLATAKNERWQSSAELATALKDMHQELTHSKNWWQRQHWAMRLAMLLPFILGLGWTVKDILFPVTTQQLIERQLAEANKIAILPFDNISGDPLIQIFGDGLAVNLGTDLAAIAQEQGNTWIVPATEISRMKEVTPKTLADKYGVDLILTGSLQHMGSTRLMVLNLLNAQTGQQVKTSEIQIDATQLFQGHDRIRQEALSLLEWTVPNELASQFERERPQLDGAYREYVQGRGYLYRYDQGGNLDKALLVFNSALAIDPQYESALVGLAEAQLRKFIRTNEVDWLDQVTQTIIKLNVVNPQNNQIDYLSAEVAMKRGEYQKAAGLYQSSIDKNASQIKFHTGLAKALKKLGKNQEAEKIHLNINRQVPNNWRVISDLGIFYFQVGDYIKAKNQFEKLSIMSPNNDLGVRNMAAAFYALGDLNNAIKYTEKAIALKPSDQAYTNLGTMYFAQGKYKESIPPFQKAVELKQHSYINWGNLADAYKLTGNKLSIESYQTAVLKAENSLEINSNDSTAIAGISYYLANLGDNERALFYAQKIDESNNGYDNFFVATAYDHLMMLPSALKHIKIAIQKKYPSEEILNTPFLKNVRAGDNFKSLGITVEKKAL